MITGVVSPEDYVEAQLVHRRDVARVINKVMAAMAIAGIALMFLGVRPWGLIIMLGGIGGLAGEWIQSRWYIPAKARKHYAQFKGVEAPVTYRWDAERLFVSSARGSGERSWKDLHKARESETVFVLYTTDVLFEVVPKRWFEGEGQVGEFRRLAGG